MRVCARGKDTLRPGSDERRGPRSSQTRGRLHSSPDHQCKISALESKDLIPEILVQFQVGLAFTSANPGLPKPPSFRKTAEREVRSC
jgi:hypothetical protein